MAALIEAIPADTTDTSGAASAISAVSEGNASLDLKTTQFLEWLRDNGARFPKLLFPSTDTISGMRGTVALETIETDEVMLEIPAKLMMTELNVLNDPVIGSCMAKNTDIIYGDTMLALFIMKEYLLREESFYWPYLAILPPPGTVSEWSREELDELQVGMSVTCFPTTVIVYIRMRILRRSKYFCVHVREKGA
jgi:hypothetical protein